MIHRRLERREACLTLGALLAGGLSPGAAVAADAFPSRPVTLVVPFVPGQLGDLWARLVAPRLSALWKQPVIVENKPGAGTMIGADFVRRSVPDGHTLLLGSLSTAMAKLTNANAPFDPQVELAPVCKYISLNIIIVTNAVTYAKAKNLQEMAAFSKTTPGGLFFGGTGSGTALNMAAAFPLQGLEVRYSDVNYNGSPPATVALIRNDVQLLTQTPSFLKAHIDAGTIHPMAALGEDRFPELPNVQTVREAGFKGFFPILWNGVYAAKNTPEHVLDRIARDIHAVQTAPDMKNRIEAALSGLIPNSTPQSFARDLVVETKEWREYLASINFKPQ